eukprot:199975_1
MSEGKESLTIGFGDTILLPHDTIGTVRFIGFTEFKKNIIFYGIHLKDANGKHNGSFGKRRYFKCPKSHGIFTEKKTILDILKKHSISASFHYGQTVQIINSANGSTIGKGILRYIGLTKYDNYKNYYYGVRLDESMKSKHLDQIKTNQHIQTVEGKNIYFDAEPKRSVFVRQNQLRCVAIKSLNRKKPTTHLKTKPKKKPRAQSMLPQSKTQKKKLKAKMKKRKSLKAKTLTKDTPSPAPKTPKSAKKKGKTNAKKSAKKSKDTSVKKDKQTPAKKGKRKKRKANRKATSDLGAIRANFVPKPNKIMVTSSEQMGTEFNGCTSPTKARSKTRSKSTKRKTVKNKSSKKEKTSPNTTSKSPKSSTKSAKKAHKKVPKPKLNRKRSTSTITVDAKYKKNLNKISAKPIKKNKRKVKKKSTARSKSAKPKEKTGRNRATSYDVVINNEDTFCQYIDNKHFYYHQQYTKQYQKDNAQTIVNRIRQRSTHQPPPTMGSFFSTRSRMNQRKKRTLPSAPQVYTITIHSRPMGFFIETKKLHTITENADGEQITEQVEIADKDNKFNKMNAYISMVQAEEWVNVLIVGSQLLSINSESITGQSFTSIFQKLSSHPLPFTLELAAPTDGDSPVNSGNENEEDVNEEEPVDHSRRLMRGQTFDATKAAGRTERKNRFRFHLF